MIRWIRRLLHQEPSDDAYQRFVDEYEKPRHAFWLSRGFLAITAGVVLAAWLLSILLRLR